jgi:branched-chain amino acid transport system ATP-binding protein
MNASPDVAQTRNVGPAVSPGDVLLTVNDLNVSYGGIKAVKGIALTVNAGEMVCLIGANGAGKSSTLKAIAGLLPSAPASVVLAGEPIGGLSAHERVRRGLALVPEGRGIFAQLTVDENLAMGAYVRTDTSAVRDDQERVFELFPRLKERRKQTGGTLSGGEQQMLAIGRALMSKPRLLLLDEPSMGLAPIIVARIFEIITAIRQQGVTTLVVEQNARLALEACDRGYVMESGRIGLNGTAKALLTDDAVRKAYLGE